MSKIVHLPERAGVLFPGQFEITEFVFEAFKMNPSWEGRTDVVCSQLRAAVFPQATDRDTSRYEPFIAASEPMLDLHKVDGAYNASSVTFNSVAGRYMVVGLLIHSKREPIAHIGHAAGLPLWTNGSDIIIAWDRGPTKIFRI